MPTIRTFIALSLPREIATAIASIQEELIASHAEVKWDTSDKFHITLKFLGDTDSSLVPRIAEELQHSVGSLQAFEIAYEKLGGFPNTERPRVVWIGARENQQIRQLQAHVERVCTSLGFPKEDRPFHVHITLGRVKGGRNLDRLTASLKSVTFEPLLAQCTHVHIIRSDLKPTGSTYSLLNSIPLAS